MLIYLFIIITHALDLEHPIAQHVYCGLPIKDSDAMDQQRILFLISNGGVVFRSLDYGRTWNNESLVFEKLNLNDEYLTLYVSPANKEVIYLFGLNGNGVRSEDCGNHYVGFKYDRGLSDFKLNSMDDMWLLGTKECCTWPYDKEVHVSLNGGDTWQVILKDVRQASWDKLIDSDFIDDKRIVSAHLDDSQPVVSYSDDLYKTKRYIHSSGSAYFQSEYNTFVTVQYEDTFQLYVSPAFYDSVEMRQLQFPLITKSFTLMETASEQIFVCVVDERSLKDSANLYVSGYEQLKFTLSLTNVVANNGLCQTWKIHSMPGVFIANIRDNNHSIRTVISFDKGGIWQPLKVSSCGGDCSLHIIYQPLSELNNVGLVIAWGSIGTELSQDNINTYLSRDGGRTWHEIYKGNTIAHFANRGSLILISDMTMSNRIYYSWDQGLNWTESILKQNITVDEFISFSLYPYFNVIGRDKDMHGVVLSLEIKTRICQGSWNPGTEESDYEIMSTNECLYGQKWKFVHRKRNAACLNQMQHDKMRMVETCPCTVQDWECDFGFYRQLNDCIPIAKLFEEDDTPDLLKPPTECDTQYEQTQGYRKIVGSFCVGGLDLSPKLVPCPTPKQVEQVSQENFITNETDNFDNLDFIFPGIFLVLLLTIIFFLYKKYGYPSRRQESELISRNIKWQSIERTGLLIDED